jgi:hypothetical protein
MAAPRTFCEKWIGKLLNRHHLLDSEEQRKRLAAVLTGQARSVKPDREAAAHSNLNIYVTACGAPRACAESL